MDISAVADLAPELSSLEVALLLTLAAREQCFIETTEDAIHDVAKELALVINSSWYIAAAANMVRYPRIHLTRLILFWNALPIRVWIASPEGYLTPRGACLNCNGPVPILYVVPAS